MRATRGPDRPARSRSRRSMRGESKRTSWFPSCVDRGGRCTKGEQPARLRDRLRNNVLRIRPRELGALLGVSNEVFHRERSAVRWIQGLDEVPDERVVLDVIERPAMMQIEICRVLEI